jgi:hypothetical protein
MGLTIPFNIHGTMAFALNNGPQSEFKNNVQ